MSQAPPPPDAPTPASPSGGAETTSDERNMAMLAHLLGFFFSIIPALLIWLLKKDTSAYINDQAKEALNFQITMLIGYAIASVTTYILIGCFIFPVIFLLDLIFCIIAAVAASRGERYRYPIAIRLVS
jgi:uncharacterized protein